MTRACLNEEHERTVTVKKHIVRTVSNDRHLIEVPQDIGDITLVNNTEIINLITANAPAAADIIQEFSGTFTADNSVLGSWVPTDKATENVEICVLAHEEPVLNAAVYRIIGFGVARFAAVPNTSYILATTNLSSGGMNLAAANVQFILPGGGDPSVQILVTGDNVHAVNWRAIVKRYILG